MAAIMCVVFGYSMALNLAYGLDLAPFNSVTNSVLSLYETILGQFRPFEGMLDKNAPFSFQVSGWIYFITLLQVLILIVSNSFIAIITHAFAKLDDSGEGYSTYNTNIIEFRQKIERFGTMIYDMIWYARKRKVVDETNSEDHEEEEKVDDFEVLAMNLQLDLIGDVFGKDQVTQILTEACEGNTDISSLSLAQIKRLKICISETLDNLESVANQEESTVYTFDEDPNV